MKNVYLSSKACEQLTRYGDYDTRLHRYILKAPRKVYRIRLDALDTTAALSEASDKNPNGWERVKVIKGW